MINEMEPTHINPNKDGFLLIEEIEEFEFVTETTENGGKLYIEGIFLQANIPNRNKRFYPSHVMEKAVEVYRPKINKGEAYGELDHPPSLQLHAQNLSHKIVKLERNGDNWLGKAEVLENTRNGKQIVGLVKDGVKLGASSRGAARAIPSNKGYVIIQDNFRISTAADVVIGPSAPDASIKLVTESDRIIAENIVYNGKLLHYDNVSEEWVEATRDLIMSADANELNETVLPNLLINYLRQSYGN